MDGGGKDGLMGDRCMLATIPEAVHGTDSKVLSRTDPGVRLDITIEHVNTVPALPDHVICSWRTLKDHTTPMLRLTLLSLKIALMHPNGTEDLNNPMPVDPPAA